MADRLDVQAPIMLIGAGRSGTTLVMRMLRSHPDVQFRGETSFLVPRLWKECFENRFWHNWERYVAQSPNSGLEPLPAASDHDVEAVRIRTGAAVARMVVELLGVNREVAAWGYKELWNGSGSFDYSWAIYDDVFPRATWVHLIRNPFTFARSAARWTRQPMVPDGLLKRLEEWVHIVRRSRERAGTGRYFEIRYEDVVLRPQGTLNPILNSAGLSWCEEMEKQLNEKVLDSHSSGFRPSQETVPSFEYFSDRVEGLSALMSELEYDLVPLEMETDPTGHRENITRL